MLLLKFGWTGSDTAQLAPVAAQAGAKLLSLHCGMEVDEGYAYLETFDTKTLGGSASGQGDALRGALGAILQDITVVELAPMQDVAGASAGEAAPYHYIVETDVLPEMEDDLNAWYREEHLPGLASVPGTVRAARFRNTGALDTGPRYHACYDLVTPDTLGSPPWLKIRGTAWSSRVRPAFRNTKRTMFRRVSSTSSSQKSPLLQTVRVS